MNGLFIVIEGLDGAGSSTQVEKLANYLKQRNYKVLATKEPTNNIIGGLIRGQLTHDWHTVPECLQLLFAADRAHHLKKEINPALTNSYIVISDRYIFSTIAYGALDLDYNWLKEINKNFKFPDLYFIINTDPEECIKRLKKTRYKLELFEDLEKLKKVHENFLRLINDYKQTHNNIYTINGNQLIEDIFDDIKAIVKLKINSTKNSFKDSQNNITKNI